MQKLGDLRLEEHIAIQKIAHDLYGRQQKLTQEIRALGALVAKREGHGIRGKESQRTPSLKKNKIKK
jgi:hypothetical protein